ncbi:hypothetical protein D8790_04405 [Streptococcus cristatus]|uniref:Uncharacterized protein n=1 Tax=Streptococcus cristatus TaxID=45634 RepID=A0A428HJW6_STRCR|nr:hypothetical protein D8790_04405 [Streptococcus cristatus]
MSCFKNFKKWVVKNRGITKISLIFVGISFLPVLYVLVKKFFKEYIVQCERKQDPEYYVKLGEERVYLANLSSAYFENYFPKFLGKVKESNQ